MFVVRDKGLEKVNALSLELNILQSAAVNKPRFVAEALGRFKVIEPFAVNGEPLIAASVPAEPRVKPTLVKPPPVYVAKEPSPRTYCKVVPGNINVPSICTSVEDNNKGVSFPKPSVIRFLVPVIIPLSVTFNNAFDYDINDCFTMVNLKIVDNLCLEKILRSLIHGFFYLQER